MSEAGTERHGTRVLLPTVKILLIGSRTYNLVYRPPVCIEFVLLDPTLIGLGLHTQAL